MLWLQWLFHIDLDNRTTISETFRNLQDDNKNLGEVLAGGEEHEKKSSFSFSKSSLANAFPAIWTLQISKSFATNGGISGLKEESNKYSRERQSHKEFIEIWENVSLRIISNN